MKTKIAVSVFISMIISSVSSEAVVDFNERYLPDNNLWWTSSSGALSVSFKARALLSGFNPQSQPAYLITETEPFIDEKLSLFSDLFIGKSFYSRVELRLDHGEIPAYEEWSLRLEQAFVQESLFSSDLLNLELGKFLGPFGQFPARHDSTEDPFIRPPLMYEYRTMICPAIVPRTNDGFINWKNSPGRFRPVGAPVIWGAPYQIGAMVFGTTGKINYRVALVDSAPSSEPVEWDRLPGAEYAPSISERLGVKIMTGLEAGIAHNSGPYSAPEVKPLLPAGKNINDYLQEIWALDAAYMKGWTTFRAEVFLDKWTVPNVRDDPEDLSFYAEIKQKILPGLFCGLRYGAINFSSLRKDPVTVIYYNPAAYLVTIIPEEKWDYDVERWQLSAGYNLGRTTQLLIEYMINTTKGPYDPDDNLLSLQCRLSF